MLIPPDEVVKLYNNNMSIPAIAKKFNTYNNKIRRILVKAGTKMRDKREAQKVALASGRAELPKWDDADEVKKKISQSISDNWKNLSDNERKQRSDIAKEQWENMSDVDKKNLKTAAHQALIRSSKEGSKLEKFVRRGLTDSGYVVQYHYKGIVGTTTLEIDFFLPKEGIVIEIDGPSHFRPIWGQAALEKTIESDNKKAGMILAQGWIMIRVKYVATCNSQRAFRETLDKILQTLNEIKTKRPPKNKRFIEIEVQ